MVKESDASGDENPPSLGDNSKPPVEWGDPMTWTDKMWDAWEAGLLAMYGRGC